MTKWSLTGFLCETTLTDQDQRISVIGIMPGRIAISGLPSAMTLGAFVRVHPLPPDGTPVRVEFLLNETPFLDLEAASVAAPPEAANEYGLDALHLNLARVMVMVNEPSVITLRVRVAGEDPEILSALKIELAKPVS